MFNSFCAFLIVYTGLMLGAPVHAMTLRWASQGDPSTMDPHAFNEALTNSVNTLIYEALVSRDKQYKIEPRLAVSWSQSAPTLWRFNLRPGVKFQDGTPFTADDVVFSIERAASPKSNVKVFTTGIVSVTRVDDRTVDIALDGPNPVLLQQLVSIRIMSKAWAEMHNALKPQDFSRKEETYVARHANGTGPYILKSFEPDFRTVLVENPGWWRQRDGNVTEIIYLPIKSPATRTAALLSGEVDFVLDPPPQDLARMRANGIKVVDGPEARVIFLGLDQGRDELLYSNVKAKNPFKDLRVRQAIYHAIDIEAIRAKIMQNEAIPTGLLVARQVDGYPAAADRRLPLDRAKAKQLLAAAGYPDGFEVTLDCTNNRYISDEAICQAVAGMLAQIGITVKLNSMPRATFFPKIEQYDTSLYMLGWAPATNDALNTLQVLVHSVGRGGDGEQNFGRYSNPSLDATIDAIKTELDATKRDALVAEALSRANTDVAYVPLHQQMIPWAMRANVTVVHAPNNYFRIEWVEIK